MNQRENTMKRVFYGTCKTGAATSVKIVVVPDLDITEENFQFDEGDLLVVFFADGNTSDTPSIVIRVSDSEEEISISDDSGKLIKTLDTKAELANCWQMGETLIFVYTQQDTSGVYYWELIDAAHATTTDYGNTKLFDISDSDEDYNNWLAGTDFTEYDDTVALTPAMLKKFFTLLKGEPSSDDGGDDSGDDSGEQPSPTDPEEIEPVIPLLGLSWTPSETVSQYETQPLGTLSLTNGTSGIEINYPIDALIQHYIETVPTITHTGQLFNNGNGGQNAPKDEAAEPFITRYIPNNLYFNNGNGLYYNNDARFILNDGNNKVSIGGNALGILLNKPTQISGNTSVTGTLTTSGNISSGSALIQTTGDLKGGVIYEGGTSLRKKYSALLTTENRTTGNINVAKGGEKAHILFSVAKSGWTPIGVVGYNISKKDGATGEAAQDARYANLWECFITGNNVDYAVYNMRSKAINIKITFNILYCKNI